MYESQYPGTDSSGSSTPPPAEPFTTSSAGEPEPEPPRIRATLHEPVRWRQLFREFVTLSLDTLDDMGDRMSRELGIRPAPATAPKDDAA